MNNNMVIRDFVFLLSDTEIVQIVSDFEEYEKNIVSYASTTANSEIRDCLLKEKAEEVRKLLNIPEYLLPMVVNMLVFEIFRRVYYENNG